MKKRVIIFILIFVAALTYSIYDQNYNYLAIRNMENLELEYNKISCSSDGITLLSTDSSHRENRAHFEARFSTTHDFNYILNLYKPKLDENGWCFIKDESLRSWGKDVGEKVSTYRKDDYVLEIFYFSGKENSSSKFNISLAWGF